MAVEEELEVLKGYLDKLINMPYALDGDILAFEMAIRYMEAWPEIRDEIEASEDKIIYGFYDSEIWERGEI